MSEASVRMDRLYRHQRHVYDLTRKCYLAGRDRLIAGLLPPPGGRVLEVGCGTARNLVRAARAWPEAHFYGLDVSPEMLRTARGRVERAGLAARIVLAAADATRFDPALLFGVPCFARILFSYSLSMIPDWPAALRAGLRAWLRGFDVTPCDGLAAELARLAGQGGEVVRLERPLGGYAQHAVFRRTPAHGAPVRRALATP